ncbi:MAG: 2Fe-2S iron-sulfur cluster binding domain-containing protein [Mesorhizobium sp.]|uniref:2Fe-2S iron-sulfur cluster-binding protein n=1 Tax=Mesorhizobium sp. TaxID=1871066 RepID=UPI0011F91803|nr:2Fe-2S iron-sulfur cluster-binding protein [Mesorhizobium sp.]TIR47570.1 MAG: 2Fe-2S iron-sulfur cluster binding domain-containing protein [Mesorhizobium sp.]
MIHVNVTDRAGNTSVLPWEDGEVLMEVIRDNNLPILASCGGSCACATCHVYVQPSDFARLGPRSDEEAEMLMETDTFDERKSRLSCQIKFDRALDGLSVTLAPEEPEI